jgi:ABC-type multidrug transport system ATPase subunit
MTVGGTMSQYVTLNYGFSIDKELRTHLIDEILELSGLTNQKNTPVGDVFRKGCSGGQKRRLSIALELVARPKVLVLDEPTTGLDSASAYHIITKLKSIAVTLKAVIIASLHQPSSEIWESLDRLLLLSKGMVMYEGMMTK